MTVFGEFPGGKQRVQAFDEEQAGPKTGNTQPKETPIGKSTQKGRFGGLFTRYRHHSRL